MTLHYVVCDDDFGHVQIIQKMLGKSDLNGSVALAACDPQEVLAYNRTTLPYTIYFGDLKLDDADQP